ncbi:granulocyte colony-stimulating factor receptor [Bombina bombina]|uniref:granulocyte colony-stimulating factor receptor n=1 Tax=Bombina bombina TaxID=8345 RepID=UPI00235AE65A|nr:granulocyte colony-stimulating factor receptor [Bombina bombina]
MQRDRRVFLVEMLLFLFLPDAAAQSCGEITVKSPIIHLGSSLSATCTIYRKQCKILEEDVQMFWKLDDKIIPTSHYSTANGNTSTVYFSSFNQSSAFLYCYIMRVGDKTPNIVDRVQIKAGYPPAKPSNLSCVLNFTDESLICSWVPGRDPLIDTNVTLSLFRSKDQCKTKIEMKHVCIPVKGQSSCIIYREQYSQSQKIALWVTMKNYLGIVTSAPLCLLPIDSAKLDPPIIEKVVPIPSRSSCVSIRWRRAKAGIWVDQWYQLRYKREGETKWSEPKDVVNGSMQSVQCGLLPASKYHFQIRCIKSRLRGYWSEWGAESSFITSESAVKEKLDIWWKTLRATDGQQEQIQLLWKAAQTEAMKRQNAYTSQIWYIVKIVEFQGDDIVVCNTTSLSCSFPLPLGVRGASVWAHNKAGQSPETKVFFFDKNGPSASWIQTSPHSNHSLHVEWDQQGLAKGYVLEWCQYSLCPNGDVNWKTEPAASRTSILHDNIEPFQMYNVSLYPLYDKVVGSPVQTSAYSRQGAPAFSPNLTATDIRTSQAELSWKPIPLESRHGFITSYTLFWIDESEKVKFAVLNGSTTTLVITNLRPSTLYKFFLMSSTAGGSVNGTIMMLHTRPSDEIESHVLAAVFSISTVLFIFSAFTYCLLKHMRMKKRFWPIVPDPANSSLGSWSPMLQEHIKIPITTSHDFNHLITSDLTILEGWTEKKKQSDGNLQTLTSNFKEGFFQAYSGTSPSLGQDSTSLRSYINVIDSVQYAQVITGGYRQQSPPASLYVRSDSTQPLLSDMSPSPQKYENMWFLGKNQDNVFLEENKNKVDFPLLQGLRINVEGEVFSF